MSTNLILGKIIVQGTLECQSPLHIGSGSKDRSDMDILLDSEGRPFIPATSFVGVLRHAIKPDADEFWGYARDNDGRQSALCCSDLLCQTEFPKTVIRDGIEIDNSTGMVKDQSKYDYEVVERGTRFKLNMEFNYRQSDKEFVRRMAATIYTLLRDKKIRLGAKTNNGFGEIRLVQDTAKIYEFSFSKDTKNDVLHWLTRNFSAKQPVEVEKLGTPFDITPNRFSINASFWLKNSLIVRSYSSDPDAPDATHITSGKDWIVPGTSLKGAIRARAERIVNTLDKPMDIVENLFGYVIEQARIKLTRQTFRELRNNDIPEEILHALQPLENRSFSNKEGCIDAVKKHVGEERAVKYAPLIQQCAKEMSKEKGRIRVKETVLPQFVADMQILVSEMQTRIKIDRFTCGTIESALFETMPVFSSGQKPEHVKPEELINVQIHVRDCQKYEAGLLLLVLKDLWTGDLAVGGEKNVGRGVFQGIQAKILWNDQELCTIPERVQDVPEEQKEALNAYVQALNDYGNTNAD